MPERIIGDVKSIMYSSLTTSQQVIGAIRQSVCRMAISDVVWSDGGLSLLLNNFMALLINRASIMSFLHPVLSNGKVEAAVKSTTRLLNRGRSLDSSETLPEEKVACLQHKNYLGVCIRHSISTPSCFPTRMIMSPCNGRTTVSRQS